MQNPLVDIFTNHAKDENGLSLLSSPTGSGKTHSMIEAISKLLKNKKFNRQIFFISNKKNIVKEPYEMLLDKLQDTNKEAVEKVLYLKSDIDLAIDFFVNEKVYEKYKDKISSDLRKEFDKAANFFHIIFKLKDDKDILETKRDKVNKLKELIKSKFKDKKLLQQNKFWLKKLFPSLYLNEYDVIFLNTDKFMSGYFTLQGLESFLNIKDKIIFIDEFDASKERILKALLKDIKSDNIIADFLSIYQKLNNLPPNIDEIKKLYEKTKKYLDEIYKDFHLAYPIVNKTDVKKEAYILRDGDIVIPHISSSRLDFCFNDKTNKNEIVQHNKKRSCKSLLQLERQIIYYLTFGFPIFFESMARKYKKFHKNIDIYAARETILNRYKLSETEKNKILKRIVYANLRVQNIKRDKIVDFWDRGFSISFLQDDINHNEDTYIFFDYLSISPEYLIFALSKKNKIIGVSATVEINSLIHNYNLEYLKRKLGDRFKTLTKEETKKIKKYMKELKIIEKKGIEIKVKWLPETHKKNLEEIKDNLFNLLSDIDYIFLENYINNELSMFENDIMKVRALSLAYLLASFLYGHLIKKEIDSFIYFGNRINDIEDIINFAKKVSYLILKGKLEYKKEEFFEIVDNIVIKVKANEFKNIGLENRTSFFLITTYKSLMEGVNLKHKFDPKNLGKKVVQFGSFNSDVYLKDIDGIYLEKPTFFVDTKDSLMEDIYNYLTLYNFCLYYHPGYNINSNNAKEFVEELKKRRKKDIEGIFLKKNSGFFQNRINRFYHDYIEDFFNNEIAYLVIQTIGRLNRTSFKNKKIQIYMDEYFKRYLESFYYSEAYKKGVFLDKFNKIIKQSLENSSFNNTTQKLYDRFTYEVSVKNTLIKSDIDGMLSAIFTEDYTKDKAIRDWQELREIVLRYPTLKTTDTIEIGSKNFNVPNIYVKLPILSTWYSFLGKYVGDIKKVSLKDRIGELVSDDELKQIMKIKVLKEYFESKGYATFWQEGYFLMAPIVYNNIYKGALGEIVGEYIFRNVFDLELEDLDKDSFEVFDKRYKDVYFDFKFYKDTTICKDDNMKELTEKLLRKKRKYNIKKLVIANIYSKNSKRLRYYDDNMNIVNSIDEATIVSIPSMLDFEKNSININLVDSYYTSFKRWLNV